MKQTTTLVIAVAAFAAVAYADPREAEKQFKLGKQLMDAKKYADACVAFEKSFKADPAVGAELNVAKCYEEWGKLARALAAYQKAEQMAKEANDNRVDKIHGLVTALDPQVPRITILLSK